MSTFGQRRRQQTQFVALYASKDGNRDIEALVHEARRRLPALAHHAKREEAMQAAFVEAEKEADATKEIFLTGVPIGITAGDLVQAVLENLRHSEIIEHRHETWTIGMLERHINSAVLKCELHDRRNQKLSTARLLVRNGELAEDLICSSPAQLHGQHVVIQESTIALQNASTGNMNANRHHPLDPRRMSWKLGQAQVGEKLADDLFSWFWVSSAEYNIAAGSYVELKPVDRTFTVTTGGGQLVLKTGPTGQDFAHTSSRIRLEVPFHFLSADPRIEENGEHFAVHFPISKPPLIYRGDKLTGRAAKDKNWDFMEGSEKCRWIRTVDPTHNSAFARCTGIRLLFHPEEIYRFFRELNRLCITSVSRPQPVTVHSEEELVAPNLTEIYRNAAKHCGVSFSLRYAVDRVLSQHRLPLSFLTPEFWMKLSGELTEEDALVVVECMSFRLSDVGHSAVDVNAKEILDDCIRLCNIERVERKARNLNGLHHVVMPSDDETSDVTNESDEDVKIEKYVPGITPERQSTERKGPGQSPSSDREKTLSVAKIKRPAKTRTNVRRLLYTPTRTISLKPERDLLNRVLREFAVHKERFIRVTFCDEDYNSVAYTGSNDLLTRVRQALRDGVYCAGEKFVFLAFSNSQLREGAVWMYNENPNINQRNLPPTADEIRKWMGDFSQIRIPAKFSARQGQAFSSTIGVLTLDALQEIEIKDVYDRKGNYAFSDGVGIISSNLARKVCEKLHLRPPRKLPSAFQVRYGGAKGILTVWDAAMPDGNGQAEIALRPSMKKFGCKHKVLEVVGIARRLPMFLNRQIIMLLSGMGVPDEPFEDMQKTLLRSLDRAMQSDGAEQALDLLFSSGFCDYNIKLSYSTPSSMNPSTFFRAGLTCTSCEHLFNMMYAFRRRTIKDVMGRARIPVDWSKAVSAVGVMDELGVLNPGQLFCQFTQPTSKTVGIIKGMVTVGRYPCHHPGDIQPLLAVDVPALHHLVDVIVFPKTGWRPITSMLSGGDLDGDIYFCIFDERIAFPPNGPFPPMNYQSPKPIQLQRDVTTDDVADFFVDYMRNDKLGQIASAHMMHADRESDGIFSKKCLKLAEMHSVAVDFAKTGIPAHMPREIRNRGKNLKYPDFMGKPDRISYESRKVLGKLYRACTASSYLPSDKDKFQPNESSRHVNGIIDRLGIGYSKKFAREAEVLCDAYNVELIRLMEQYGVQSEGEMMSGQVVSFSANHAQLRARREFTSLLARMNYETNELQKQFRKLFFRGMDQVKDNKYNAITIGKACVWYKACRKRAEADTAIGNVSLLSFPWVVSDVLLKVLGDELSMDDVSG